MPRCDHKGDSKWVSQIWYHTTGRRSHLSSPLVSSQSVFIVPSMASVLLVRPLVGAIGTSSSRVGESFDSFKLICPSRYKPGWLLGTP